MSHASAVVRFQDGTIMHTEYNGTVDTPMPRLYHTEKERNDNWRRFDVSDFCDCMTEPVQYWAYYGGGLGFTAFACREHMHVWAPDIYERQERTDERPSWA